MRLGLVAYGSLDVRSGGNLYDRKLVSRLRVSGHEVSEISLPAGSYTRHLVEGLRPGVLASALAGEWDLLLQDELAHPSLFRVNRRLRHLSDFPIIAIVHHLRSCEHHPGASRLLYRFVERAYLRSVDAFVFNSANTRREVEGLLGQGAPGKGLPGLVAHPGGDRLPVPAGPKSGSAADEPLRLVFVGNLIRRKNLETVLRAMARARLSSTLDLIGGGDSEPSYAGMLRRLVGELGLGDRVRFLGSLQDEALAERLSSSDLLVAPSTWEGFGIVYLEGMAFGLPAIAGRAGAADEVVTEGVTGFLIDSGDVDTLAAHLDRLAGDRELLSRMSEASRDAFRERPGWDETMGRVEAWLEERASEARLRAGRRAQSAA